MHEIVRFDAGPGRNPIGLLGTLGISKRKPSSFICPLAQGPGNLTTQAPHQDQEHGIGGLAGWPGPPSGWQLMVRPLCPLTNQQSHPPLLLLLHGAHLPFCRSLVTTLTLETGQAAADCPVRKFNILRSHESNKVFTYIASYLLIDNS